jgi:hypothetical protein
MCPPVSLERVRAELDGELQGLVTLSTKENL